MKYDAKRIAINQTRLEKYNLRKKTYNQENNVKEMSKSEENKYYNKLISDELGEYRNIVGFGNYSKVFRSGNSREVYEMITGQAGSAKDWRILAEALDRYSIFFNSGDAETVLYAIAKLSDLWESFISSPNGLAGV